MALRASRSSRKPFLLLLLTGLVALIAWLVVRKKASSPQETIRKVFESETALDDRMIRFYTVVSALETNFWTSSYFKDLNNLYNMTLPKGKTTAIGKAGYGKEPDLAKFSSLKDSAKDFVLYLFTRFKYPMNFYTLEELARYMKSKGYYTSSEKDYAIRLNQVYKQLYG